MKRSDKRISKWNPISICVIVAVIIVGCCFSLSPSVFAWGTDILPEREGPSQTEQKDQNTGQYDAGGNLDSVHDDNSPVNTADTASEQAPDHSKAEVEFDGTCFCGKGSDHLLCVDSEGSIVELGKFRGQNCSEEKTA